jgi:outer membrane receptor protein involved in Fe transport
MQVLPLFARRHALLLFGVSTVALTAPTIAQAPAAGDAGGDIIVTARKTDERLQDVPISINAVSGEQLRDRGAVDVKDVLRTIPGVAYEGTERGQSSYNIRGVATVTSSPTVGLYLDDIALVTNGTESTGAFDPVFFDMARIEVLKGPQGTLYGGSSMGGAIKYVSARPDLARVGGSAAVGVATTAHGAASYNGEGVINLPIVTDRLAIRVGGYYHHDGGYIDNRPNLPLIYPNQSSSPSPIYTPLVVNSGSNRDREN